MDFDRKKMSTESFNSRQPPLEQSTELVTQHDESQGVNIGIYIPTSQQEVISRNASLRKAVVNECDTGSQNAMASLRPVHLTSVLENTIAAVSSPAGSHRSGSSRAASSGSQERERS